MKIRKYQKRITPLSYIYYFISVAIIVIAGLFNSIYLAISHFRIYTDIGYQSFCAISRSLNCDTVSQSQYSIFLGIPVAVWGILAYAFFLWLLSYAWPKKNSKNRVWTLLFIISLGVTIYSIILAVLSTFYIQSYCIMCILGYAVNLMLLYFTWIVRKRFECEPVFKALVLDVRYLTKYPRTLIPSVSFFGICVIALYLFLPVYWHMDPPELSKNIPVGTTEQGHPWIGAEDPGLEILEFSDYRCFQCKKMHYFLRRLIRKHPDKIRLVHRHFPMDHTINPIVDEPFHQGSAKLALVSVFAAKKDKFWEMNDILFDISKQTEAVNIKDLARQAGFDSEEIKYIFRDNALWNELKRDIRAGLEYGLTGTPGFVINDEVYLGQIPPEVLRSYR